MRPAFASVLALLAVPALVPREAAAVTCSTSAPCSSAVNSGSGPGFSGTSAGSYGSVGQTTFNATSSAARGAGIFGQDLSTNQKSYDYGVLGSSIYGTGASGLSRYWFGLIGTSSKYVGVYGGTSGPAQPTLGALAGVIGVNQLGTNNVAGVIGKTAGAGYGVAGLGSGTNYNVGVYGTSPVGTGVQGYSSSGIGIFAQSDSGQAINAQSGGDGIYAEGGIYGVHAESAGTALEAVANGGGSGITATAGSGYGLHVTTGSGTGIRVGTSGGAGVISTAGNGFGVDASGGYGVIGRTGSGGYPFLATDATGANNLFYVDGAGNVSYRGTLKPFARAAGGKRVSAFSPETTAPTLEDVGSAQLAGGAAMVAFSPEFAAALDSGVTYHVFLTPDGDTRGLYVARKTARGFVVRETQGGRGTFAFDYRVVGTALGNAGKRAAFVQPEPNGPHAPAPAAPRVERK